MSGAKSSAQASANAPADVSIGLSLRYRVFRTVVVALGRLLVGFTVHGAWRVPESGALIVASNHRRYLDPVYISMAVPRRLQWMGKKSLFTFPFARLFYLIGCFPVDREGGGRAALKAALRYLELGAALGIFPEGTRRRGGYDPDASAKSGAAMLASRSGARVLPVHVGPVPNPVERLRGERLEVHIGEPRAIGGEASGGRAYREAVDSLLAEIYALPREPGKGQSYAG